MSTPSERDPLLGSTNINTDNELLLKFDTNRRKLRHVGVAVVALVTALGTLALCGTFISLSGRGLSTSSPLTIPPPQQLSPLFNARPPIPVNPPTLLAVGDWGRGGIAPQRRVAASMADSVKKGEDITVLSTGDNFYDNGVETPHDLSWNMSYEGVYSAQKALANAPFLPVLGNHDHLGDALAQVEYTKYSRNWHLPARFNAELLAEQVLLVRIDTTPFLVDKSGRKARRRGFRPDPQVAWFKEVMKEADRLGLYVVVMGHHNMYSGSTCGNKKTMYIRKKIEGTLVKYKKRVLAYVCGHEHALEHVKAKGIDHFISGGGSLLDEICLKKKGKKVKHAKRLGFRHGKNAPFVRAVNGFFRFKFDVRTKLFVATAIDDNNNVIYSFNKVVR